MGAKFVRHILLLVSVIPNLILVSNFISILVFFNLLILILFNYKIFFNK